MEVLKGNPVMTKAQALHNFIFYHQGVVPGDEVWTRTNWNDYTDYLCKDGQITDHQYNTWTNPF